VRSSCESRTPVPEMFARLLTSHWSTGSASTVTSRLRSKVAALRFNRVPLRLGVTLPRDASAKPPVSLQPSSSLHAKATGAVSRRVNKNFAARPFAIAAGFLILFVLTSETVLAQTTPSAMLDQYRAVRTTWLSTAATYANRLFGLLAVIEFAWTGAILVLERTDLQGWTAALIRKMMFIGAFFALLNFGADWIPRIIESFQIVGQSASGLPSLAPTDILVRGLNIAGNLLSGAANSGWMGSFGTALALVFAALLAFLAFLGLTIQLVVTLVESYLVVGAGFIFLGFGGSRWTAPYVERYISFAVSTGVKVMVLYLLLGAGLSLTNTWEAAATAVPGSASPAVDALDIAASSVILLMICWNAPKLAASILGGAPSFTGGDAVSTAGGLAQGVLLVGAAAAGGVALGAKMLAAKGAAMATSQAAGLGASGGASGGFSGGSGPAGPAGSSGPPRGGAPQPSSGSGGAVISAGSNGQVSPPSVVNSAQTGEGGHGTEAGSSQPKDPAVASVTPQNNSYAERSNPSSSIDARPQVSPPGSGQRTERPSRMAQASEATRRVSRQLAVGTQFVRMARSSIPSDHASHSAPPALRTESEE
jgi:type IV secretion system protein TrbL